MFVFILITFSRIMSLSKLRNVGFYHLYSIIETYCISTFSSIFFSRTIFNCLGVNSIFPCTLKDNDKDILPVAFLSAISVHMIMKNCSAKTVLELIPKHDAIIFQFLILCLYTSLVLQLNITILLALSFGLKKVCTFSVPCGNFGNALSSVNVVAYILHILDCKGIDSVFLIMHFLVN